MKDVDIIPAFILFELCFSNLWRHFCSIPSSSFLIYDNFGKSCRHLTTIYFFLRILLSTYAEVFSIKALHFCGMDFHVFY